MTGRILIADGLATNRITLKVRLSAACHDVMTASAVPQLMALAQQDRPDLIILGSSLPGGDPIDACRKLRCSPDTMAIPLLVLCDPTMRLAALRAGATATLDGKVDEHMLLARIRSLLRQQDETRIVQGMAESQAPFEAADRADVTLIADTPGRALCWKHLLSQRLNCRFVIHDAEQALASAARDNPAELYVIAADLDHPGEGLRLLAELRSRPISRDASFIVAVAEGRTDISTIALDLGAGDTIPLSLQPDTVAEATAIAIDSQIRRKRQADRHRAEAERNRLWAMTDPLTGLYNRRYALPRLMAIAQDAQDRRSPFSVLAMDLDRFKLINDHYGHTAGDAVLVEVASRIGAAIAHHGLTARIGGEEFLAILPLTSEDQAAQIAETVRQSIIARPIALPQRIGGGELPVTLSIGIAAGGIEAGSDPVRLAEDAMDRADRAMLAAKSLGRNRVMRAAAAQAA